MEENNVSVQPPVVEPQKKKSNTGIIVFLVLIILGLCGYIYYKEFYKKAPAKIEEREDNKKEEPKKEASLDILKEIDLSQSINYFSYDAMYKDYLKMDSSDDLKNKIDIIDSLKFVLKVANNKIYWNKDNSWKQDEIITGDIAYLISDFSIENGYRGLVVVSGNTLYQIDNPKVSYDGFATDEETLEWAKQWISNLEYKKVELPGTIQNLQITYGYSCEGWKEFKLMINNTIYYLSSFNKDGNISLIKADKYVNKFTNLAGGCGYAPEGLLADGTIDGVTNEKEEKIKVKHYIVLGDNPSNSKVILIDKDNYLYMSDTVSINEGKEQKLTSEDKIKSIDFIEDKTGNGHHKLKIVLSDDYQMLFENINTVHN